MKLNRFIVLCTVVLCIISCSGNRFKVDVSSVSYKAEFKRLDKEMFALHSPISEATSVNLNEEYGDFFGAYTQDIMQMPPPDNPMLPEFISRFTNNPTWQNLQADIDETYPNLSTKERVLENALKAYSIHFGETNLPMLVAYNSGFNIGIYPSDDWLGVGLEWYLSPENGTVKKLPPDLFPQYKRDKMKPEYLAINALKGFLFYKNQNLAGEDMLSSMVFNGKMLFIAKALMEVSDADLLNYSDQQIDWAKDNEYSVWTFLIENDLVFSKDQKQIAKMVNDGPFTPGMPPESPGGVGNWVGLQMVEAFMDQKGTYSLKDLLKAGDREILEQYKPGR
ncbi:MAG: hypothetical protein MK086_01270 [Flavobacteriales bacterium]|nr:hypothetical protein [Flavobacteriales bacterium]